MEPSHQSISFRKKGGRRKKYATSCRNRLTGKYMLKEEPAQQESTLRDHGRRRARSRLPLSLTDLSCDGLLDGWTHARTDAFSKNAFLKTPFRERNPKKNGVGKNSRAFCLARTESIPAASTSAQGEQKKIQSDSTTRWQSGCNEGGAFT